MGRGNGQKAKMARERNLEKQKAAKGSQLETNKKAMSIQGRHSKGWQEVPHWRLRPKYPSLAYKTSSSHHKRFRVKDPRILLRSAS
ncbi:hypothetical protein ACLB2K_012699 [Fragaria x ananassa]